MIAFDDRRAAIDEQQLAAALLDLLDAAPDTAAEIAEMVPADPAPASRDGAVVQLLRRVILDGGRTMADAVAYIRGHLPDGERETMESDLRLVGKDRTWCGSRAAEIARDRARRLAERVALREVTATAETLARNPGDGDKWAAVREAMERVQAGDKSSTIDGAHGLPRPLDAT
jgi:hypothetical protein